MRKRCKDDCLDRGSTKTRISSAMRSLLACRPGPSTRTLCSRGVCIKQRQSNALKLQCPLAMSASTCKSHRGRSWCQSVTVCYYLNSKLISSSLTVSDRLLQQRLRDLRWLMQKDSLRQDVFLIGAPGSARRHLVMQYLVCSGVKTMKTESLHAGDHASRVRVLAINARYD